MGVADQFFSEGRRPVHLGWHPIPCGHLLTRAPALAKFDNFQKVVKFPDMHVLHRCRDWYRLRQRSKTARAGKYE